MRRVAVTARAAKQMILVLVVFIAAMTADIFFFFFACSTGRQCNVLVRFCFPATVYIEGDIYTTHMVNMAFTYLRIA